MKKELGSSIAPKAVWNNGMHFIATLAGRAAEAELPFLLIGGNAVIAYGYPRHTQDIDLLIRDTDRRAWDALIVPLGFRQYHIHRSFHMYSPTSAGRPPVDFMLVDVGTFEKLSAGARE